MLDHKDILIGQSQLKSRLQDTLESGRPIYHAYLFSGEEGMGKRTFAKSFAKQILCQNNKGQENQAACGTCDACRYFEAGTNPDFKHVEKASENLIKIDRVRREIITDLPMNPQFSDYKVYLLNLDDLNEQGQNALLKSLEEPPSYVVFLLTTGLIDNILETILSRVVTLHIRKYTNEEIQKILQIKKLEFTSKKEEAHLDENLDFIISYALGNPGQALKIAQDENFKKNRKQAIDLFFYFASSTRTNLLTEKLDFLIKNKDQINLFYRVWQDLIHDILLLIEDDGIQKVLQIDVRERSKRLANYYKEHELIEGRKEKLYHAYSAISEVKQASGVNTSFEGMIGQLLLTMRKDIHIDYGSH